MNSKVPDGVFNNCPFGEKEQQIWRKSESGRIWCGFFSCSRCWALQEGPPLTWCFHRNHHHHLSDELFNMTSPPLTWFHHHLDYRRHHHHHHQAWNKTKSREKSPPDLNWNLQVVILADDLGWADVSWHNPDIHTPNLARKDTVFKTIMFLL